MDSSALVAVVLEEPDADLCIAKLASAALLNMSAVTLGEASMVILSRGGQVKLDTLDALIAKLNIEIVPVDSLQAMISREAFRRYGKGRDKAKLNLGDCFVYALAKFLNEPLLFLGNDFAETDLVRA